MVNNGVVEPYASSSNVSESDRSDGLDLLEILLILSKSRWNILAATVGAMILGAALAVFLKPTFTANALILPPQQGAASSMLGQLGSLASFASGIAVKNPADVYVGILSSRTISDEIISKFNLEQVYQTKTLEDTRKVLKSNTRLIATNDGLVHVLVEDHTAERASDIANAYVDQLYAVNSHLAISEAAQRRVFFDQEVAGEKAALTAAEDDLRKTAEKTGVIQLNGQAESMIRSIAQLRAEIAAQEVHIQALRTFATDQNPETIQAQEEATALRAQLSQLEKDPRNGTPGSPEFAAGQVPAVSLEYARKFREFKYHETLFDLLSKQYEAARIDEARAAPLIQTVDRAIAPDKKSWTASHNSDSRLRRGRVLLCLCRNASRPLRPGTGTGPLAGDEIGATSGVLLPCSRRGSRVQAKRAMRAQRQTSRTINRILASETPLWALWIILRSVAPKVKSKLLGQVFHAPGLFLGPGSVIRGTRFIKLGRSFHVHGHLWMEAITAYCGQTFHPRIEIGDDVSFSEGVHISCIDRISVGNGALFGSRVYVSDHNHGSYKGTVQSHPEQCPSQRPLGGGGAVEIGEHVWIGDNVVIVGPIHIGRGAIVGANSVVRMDVPEFTMVGGIPAKALRRFDEVTNQWEKV